MRRLRRVLPLALGAAVLCVLGLEGLLLFRNWSVPGTPTALSTHPAVPAAAARPAEPPSPAGSARPASPATPVTGPATHQATKPLNSQLVSPFTGQPVASLGPVLAVPIDNSLAARPQTGLAQADIVYVLPVEGGASRLLAVYSSQLPAAVGPVRTARADDLQLLRQFGRPAFAYAGLAQPALLPVIQQARIVGLPYGVGSGYYPDLTRPSPDNVYAHPAQLLAGTHGVSVPQDIGFRFGPAPAGGTPAASWSVSYPASSFGFRWSAGPGRWLIGMDGQPARTRRGSPLSAATVLIEHTRIGVSRYPGLAGPVPFAFSTGAGTAVLLRGGRAWQVRWSRPDGSSGTTFTTLSGQMATFAPGPVWVVLTQG